MTRCWVLLSALTLVAGCGRKEPVRHYRAPKDPQWRMLAAIVPVKDETWFFKVSAAADRLAPFKDDFVAFLKTVTFENGQARWKAPPGWKEKPGSESRVATIEFGATVPWFELSVTKLAGDAGGLLANINRWRRQIGLEPASSEEGSLKLDVGGVQVVVVDLVGPQQPTGPAMAAPRSQPEPESANPSADEVRRMFVYSVPPGWVENPQPSRGRLLEFRAGAASVSFSILPGVAGGLGSNVNRWRGQVGLDPLGEEEAKGTLRAAVLLGREAWQADIPGKDRTILCLFTLGDPFSMFLKMEGPPDAVAGQKDAFDAFAASMKINH
jgi:hypothetical protein